VHFKDSVLIILPIFNSTTTIIGSFTKNKDYGQLYHHLGNLSYFNVIF